MNCKTFQQRLEERIEDTLSVAERHEVERHLAGCPHCRELDALVRGDLEVFPVEPPAGLTAAILERTTGTACSRARELLCDYVDATLEDFESKLVREHTAGCAGCRQVERTLAHLSEDLPGMARLSPDAAFAADILAATLPARRPSPRGWPRKLQKWADAWNRLLERPRFGLEASYVGALGLWVLFGLSASPFSDLPQQALSALSHGPTAGVEKTTAVVADFQSQIGAAGRRTWQASTRRGADAVDHWTTDVNRRLERTAPARDLLRRRGSELGDAALQLDLEESARAARELGESLGTLWREITGRGTGGAIEPSPPTTSDEC